MRTIAAVVVFAMGTSGCALPSLKSAPTMEDANVLRTLHGQPGYGTAHIGATKILYRDLSDDAVLRQPVRYSTENWEQRPRSLVPHKVLQR